MFLSSYENRLDKKGRVSVPSSFRSFLNSMKFNGFVTYPSFTNSSLEACSKDRIEKILIAASGFLITSMLGLIIALLFRLF